MTAPVFPCRRATMLLRRPDECVTDAYRPGPRARRVRVRRTQFLPPLALAAVLALVAANGFFVATEFALVAVRKTRIDEWPPRASRRAAVLGRLDHLDPYIAATQLGITIASLALGWIGEPALAHLIEPALEHLPGSVRQAARRPSRTARFRAGVRDHHHLAHRLRRTGAEEPGAAAARGDRVARGRTDPRLLLTFRPVIALLNGVGNDVVRLLGIDPASGHERVHSAGS